MAEYGKWRGMFVGLSFLVLSISLFNFSSFSSFGEDLREWVCLRWPKLETMPVG